MYQPYYIFGELINLCVSPEDTSQCVNCIVNLKNVGKLVEILYTVHVLMHIYFRLREKMRITRKNSSLCGDLLGSFIFHIFFYKRGHICYSQRLQKKQRSNRNHPSNDSIVVYSHETKRRNCWSINQHLLCFL